jgi:hypothetical protein
MGTGWTIYDEERLVERFKGTGDEIEYWNDSETGRTLIIVIYSTVGTYLWR